jgi:uncharacterized protein (DUF1810 family)
MSQAYAIRSRDEAVAFLNHEVLGTRLQRCCEVLLEHRDRKVQDIMGFPDDLKLRSSMTLFAMISKPDSVFHKVLNAFYSGQMDKRTFEFLWEDELYRKAAEKIAERRRQDGRDKDG